MDLIIISLIGIVIISIIAILISIYTKTSGYGFKEIRDQLKTLNPGIAGMSHNSAKTKQRVGFHEYMKTKLLSNV